MRLLRPCSGRFTGHSRKNTHPTRLRTRGECLPWQWRCGSGRTLSCPRPRQTPRRSCWCGSRSPRPPPRQRCCPAGGGEGEILPDQDRADGAVPHTRCSSTTPPCRLVLRVCSPPRNVVTLDRSSSPRSSTSCSVRLATDSVCAEEAQQIVHLTSPRQSRVQRRNQRGGHFQLCRFLTCLEMERDVKIEREANKASK